MEKKFTSNRDFYDTVSGYYDSMINSRQAIKNKSLSFKKLILPGMHYAADIGCGSGNDSIALAMNGLEVTGFDNSEKMILKAKENASKYKSDISFHQYPADKIPAVYNNKFDLILSLGNTIANIEGKKLYGSIKRIYDILKKDGIFILQILNYRIKKKENRKIIKITKNKTDYYIRFCDFEKLKFNFNILKFKIKNTDEYELLTSAIYPYDKKQLSQTLKKAGFGRLKYFSNFNKDAFLQHNSTDLIIEVKK
jgi:ubiquinone/menaquinone biosynthesis C-methylase UbiE